MSLTLGSGKRCVICAFRAADRRLLSLASTQVRHRNGLQERPKPRRPSFLADRRGSEKSHKESGETEIGYKYAPRRPSFLKKDGALYGNPASVAPEEKKEASRSHERKRWVLGNDEATPYNLVRSRYWSVVKELEDKTFDKGEGDIDGNAPRIGQLFGVSTREEFRTLATQFWDEQLDVAMTWAKKVVQPWSPGEETLSEETRRARDYEAQSIYSRLFDESGIGAREQRYKMKPVLKKMLLDHIQSTQISAEQNSIAKNLADFRYPTEWYPAARAIQRKIHLHIGPTNSGKTYHALKRLEEAETGVYAGPLRLLAHEVYSRLNAKGKVCALITGEERRIPENFRGQMSSCTVEMVPLNVQVDVAVIDEIQMVADADRGWAWTQAFLGVQAKEVHLCGEVRTKEIVEKLCKLMGDELIIHNYERLTPLECMGKSFGNKFDKLQKGDAVIVFSRVGIHAVKKQIEAETGKRCAIIYGSLPPETRAQQAALFNDQDNDYDFLVASDAVGMGLNLAIRRVIFETTVKFNGKGSVTQLSVSELKQIAGRAGRYKTAAEGMADDHNAGVREDGTPRHPPRNVGLATTLDPNDHIVLKIAMSTDVEPIKQMGLLPPTWAYRRFAAYFPRGTPFAFIVTRLPEIAAVSPMFFMCDMRDQYAVADAIEHFDMSVEDRCVFMASPADHRRAPEILVAYASHVAANSSAELLDIKELEIEILDVKEEGPDYLMRLERLHNALTLYLWLSYRFAGVFVSQPLAFHVKGLVEEKIEAALNKVAIGTKEQERRRKLRHEAQKEAKARLERRAMQQEDAPTPYSSQNEDLQEPLMDPIEEAALKGEDLENVVEMEDPLASKLEQVKDSQDDEELAIGDNVEKK